MRQTLAGLFARAERRPSGCLEWQGAQYWHGYGAVSHDGRTVRVHRLVWSMARGPLAPGDQVLHSCDNPPCIEPAHLFVGTQRDNVRDMWAKGRARAGVPGLTPEQVRHTAGMSLQDASEELGASRAAVWRARHRRRGGPRREAVA